MPDLRVLVLTLICLAAWADPSRSGEFVGSDGCRACHESEFDAWRGSHHQMAMQEAGPATVLGDFANAKYDYAGVTSTFFLKDGRYYVRTDGADGRLKDFQISHTFGVYPLQQYLVPFSDGRYQALGIAWDSRPGDQGGQRWFHLYPGEAIHHDEELHWTSVLQNWNFMCADCHSTNLQKGFSATTGSFDTTWSEISVGCEACHGPGSAHVAWAGLEESQRQAAPDKGLSFKLDERREVRWTLDAATGNARRSGTDVTHREIEVCATCHSRRGLIKEGAAREASFLDHYLPALLTEGLYHADGQVRDEVYVWGSFLQSRMYAAGVTCSDCHDPHSQQLRAAGDDVCAQCHAPARFATASHHHHPPDSSGARCTNCHMPETTYMVVDPRRDHSMRIPRPDLSAQSGAPNACKQCHSEQTDSWAATQFRDWYPQPRQPFQSWTTAFAAARAGKAGAGALLVALIANQSVPDVARATAVLELGAYIDSATAPTLQAALRDDSPLVRLAAVRVMDRVPVESALPFSAHLLQDDLLAVRSEAARVLAGAPPGQMNQAGVELLDRAIREYVDTQKLHSDRAENLLNLGNLYVSLGQPTQAESYFRDAVKREPGFIPGWINLADLYRSQGLNEPAISTLNQGIQLRPEAASLHYALGLALVRYGEQNAAIDALGRAAQLDPGNPRFAYVYGVALNSAGRDREALEALERNHRKHPSDRDTLFALATISRDTGQRDAALEWADKLLALDPGDAGARQLRQSLQP